MILNNFAIISFYIVINLLYLSLLHLCISCHLFQTYMTYAPIPNCTYGSLGDHSSTNYGTATTMLMPSTSQHNSLMMPAGHNSNNSISGKPMGCPTVVGSRQTTPPPPGSLYTSMGVCSPSVSGTMTMGKCNRVRRVTISHPC